MLQPSIVVGGVGSGFVVLRVAVAQDPACQVNLAVTCVANSPIAHHNILAVSDRPVVTFPLTIGTTVLSGGRRRAYEKGGGTYRKACIR